MTYTDKLIGFQDIMKKRFYRLTVFIFGMAFILSGKKVAFAQSTHVVYSSINISVNVMNNITVGKSRDIQLTIDETNQDEVDIDPIADPNAGMFSASGFGNASVRISYPKQIVLRNIKTGQSILFTLSLSGNFAENQSNSKILSNNPITVTLSPKGDYYFWVGGKADIKNAPQGSYSGSISMSVDYN